MNYETRKKIVDQIQLNVSSSLDDYYNMGLVDHGYFFIYPLMHLERYFSNQKTAEIKGMIEIKMTSWLIGEMMERGSVVPSIPGIDIGNFKGYDSELIDIVRQMFLQIMSCDEIKDTYGVTSAKIELINDSYLVSKALTEDKYNKEDVYYYQTHDLDRLKLEQEVIKKSTGAIFMRFIESGVNPSAMFRALVENTDRKLYLLCKERVEIDLSPELGRKLKSKIVGSRKELVALIGYFYYLGMAFHTRNGMANDANYIFSIQSENLIERIHQLTNMKEEKIRNYLKYFTFRGEGTTNQFPLFECNGSYMFIPSSIILNDWQFSIVSGHYVKNISFLDVIRVFHRA